jgi:hypothetical protein
MRHVWPPAATPAALTWSRRRLLVVGGLALAASLCPARLRARGCARPCVPAPSRAVPREKALALYRVHTGETLKTVYCRSRHTFCNNGGQRNYRAPVSRGGRAMHTTDADVRCCPDCGARWLPTEALEHPKTLPQHRVPWSVWLVWGPLMLGGVALWGLAALGLGRLTGWW